MHPYIISGKKRDIRQKVAVRLVALSIIVSFILNALLDVFKNSYPSLFQSVNDFFQNWPFLGYSIGGYITMFAVYKVLDWLFDKYLWKAPLINRILGVPDYSGTWTGELHSSYARGQSFSTEITIKQTWKEISIISKYEKSYSGSDYAILNPDSNLGKMLRYSYSNKSMDVTVEQTEHSGLCELYMSQPAEENKNPILKGTYFNNRGEFGNKGNMELRKAK